MGGKGGGSGLEGGGLGEILPKSLRRQRPQSSESVRNTLLNFGRARGGGRGGPGRRWEERGGGWARGGRPRGDPPKIPETATNIFSLNFGRASWGRRWGVCQAVGGDEGGWARGGCKVLTMGGWLSKDRLHCALAPSGRGRRICNQHLHLQGVNVMLRTRNSCRIFSSGC